MYQLRPEAAKPISLFFGEKFLIIVRGIDWGASSLVFEIINHIHRRDILLRETVFLSFQPKGIHCWFLWWPPYWFSDRVSAWSSVREFCICCDEFRRNRSISRANTFLHSVSLRFSENKLLIFFFAHFEREMEHPTGIDRDDASSSSEVHCEGSVKQEVTDLVKAEDDGTQAAECGSDEADLNAEKLDGISIDLKLPVELKHEMNSPEIEQRSSLKRGYLEDTSMVPGSVKQEADEDDEAKPSKFMKIEKEESFAAQSSFRRNELEEIEIKSEKVGKKMQQAVKFEVKPECGRDIKPVVKSEVNPYLKKDINSEPKFDEKTKIKKDIKSDFKSEAKSKVKDEPGTPIIMESKPISNELKREVKKQADIPWHLQRAPKTGVNDENETKPLIKLEKISVKTKKEVKLEINETEVKDSKLFDFKQNLKIESREDVANQGRTPRDHGFMDNINQQMSSQKNSRNSAENDCGTTSVIIIDSEEEEQQPETLSSGDLSEVTSSSARTIESQITEAVKVTERDSEALHGRKLNEDAALGDGRTLECFQCKKEFPDETTCRNHIQTGCFKRFCCEECGKGFIHRGNLNTHLRIHSGKRPFRCDEPNCGRSFAQSSNLVTHKRIHFGERPFRCLHTGCEKSFTQLSSLIYHKSSHTGMKPYRCHHPGCDSSFALRSTLVVHARTHSGERPYRCNYQSGCEKKFSNKSHLNRHKRLHSNVNF